MKKREDGKTGRREGKQSVFGPARSFISNVRLLILSSAIFIPCFQAHSQPPNIGAATPKVALPVQEKVDLSTPSLAVKSFVAALNRSDFEAATQCVFEGKAEAPRRLSPMLNEWKKIGLRVLISEPRLRLQGDWAAASLSVKVTGGPQIKDAPEQLPHAERALLRRVENQWKIVGNPGSYLQGEKPAVANAVADQAPGVELGSGFLTMIATGLAHPEVFETMHHNAQRASCQGHLKKIALAAIILAENYQQTFAITKAAQKPNPKGMNEVLQALLNAPFQKALYPYTEDAKVFFCPLRVDDAENNEAQTRRDKLMDDLGMKRTGEPYAFNAHLDGIALAKIDKPSETVLFYEGKDEKLVFRHDGKANVAFVDGHVKPIEASEARKLIWNPKGKVND